MPDIPPPKQVDPVERNARRLINILAQHSSGLRCEELNGEFQRITKLRRQSYYDCLAFAKKERWVLGGGQRQEYFLNPDGSWRSALKPLSVGEPLEKYQLEHLLSLQTEKVEMLETANRRLAGSRKAIAASADAGSTVATLVQLMADTSLNMRRRLSAAQLLLGFRSPEDITQATKQFLHSVFLDQEMDISHRLEAAELLRRAEDPRIAPAVERPTVAVVYDTKEEIEERGRRHREHIERQARLNAEAMEAERQQMLVSNGRTIVRD
jgi:hypothetical protein